MSDPILGQLIPDDADVSRDAVHIAVVPLIAGEDLYPGRPFRLARGSTELALRGDYNRGDDVDRWAVGVVDPFLEEFEVQKGQRFWGFLFPGTVTGMRHHWQHPAFIEQPLVEVSPGSREESVEWLHAFADKWNFNFGQLIAASTQSGESWDRYVVAKGHDLHSASDLDEGDEDLFWYHLERYTGQFFSPEHRAGMGWSCSC